MKQHYGFRGGADPREIDKANKSEPIRLYVNYKKKKNTHSLIKSHVFSTNELQELEESEEGKFEKKMVEDIIRIETSNFDEDLPEIELTEILRYYRYTLQELCAIHAINCVQDRWLYTINEGNIHFNRMIKLFKISDYFPIEINQDLKRKDKVEQVSPSKYVDEIEECFAKEKNLKNRKLLIEQKITKFAEDNQNAFRLNKILENRYAYLQDPLLLFSAIEGMFSMLPLKGDDKIYHEIKTILSEEKILIENLNYLEMKSGISRLKNTYWNWHYGELKKELNNYMESNRVNDLINKTYTDLMGNLFLHILPPTYNRKTAKAKKVLKAMRSQDFWNLEDNLSSSS